MKLKVPAAITALRIACVFALVGLALMMWSLFDPRPPPILIALSLGQVIGTFSLAIFVFVVVRDYRERHARAPAVVEPKVDAADA